MARGLAEAFQPFLDRMCTHIVDFQDRKANTFEGKKASCLIQLVEKHPERRHIAKQHESMAFTS